MFQWHSCSLHSLLNSASIQTTFQKIVAAENHRQLRYGKKWKVGIKIPAGVNSQNPPGNKILKIHLGSISIGSISHKAKVKNQLWTD